jgi:hypothetical protein
MDLDVGRPYGLDEASGILLGVEEISLEPIESFNAESNTHRARVLCRGLEIVDSPHPFILSSAPPGHNAEACIDGATN